MNIEKFLTPDLLNNKWKKLADKKNNFSGHCYIAAESIFHILGGKKAGYKSYVLNHAVWPDGLDTGETHWFVKNKDGKIVDPTAKQFDIPIAYEKGIACGFLTVKPSKRAKILIERLKNNFAKGIIYSNISLDN